MTGTRSLTGRTNYSPRVTLEGSAASRGYSRTERSVLVISADHSRIPGQVGGMGHALRETVAQIQSFRELEVWQLSMELVDEVIKARQSLPRVEFDLRRQITRAAISIPSNIAEGWRRKGKIWGRC